MDRTKEDPNHIDTDILEEVRDIQLISKNFLQVHLPVLLTVITLVTKRSRNVGHSLLISAHNKIGELLVP